MTRVCSSRWNVGSLKMGKFFFLFWFSKSTHVRSDEVGDNLSCIGKCTQETALIWKANTVHWMCMGEGLPYFKNFRERIRNLLILAECSLCSHPSRRHMAGIQRGSNLEFERNRTKFVDFSLNKHKRFTHCGRAARAKRAPFHEFFIWDPKGFQSRIWAKSDQNCRFFTK